MEKLFCKLIAVFISLGLAVTAQASPIGNNGALYSSTAKGGGSYFASDKISDWQGSNPEVAHKLSSLDTTDQKLGQLKSQFSSGNLSAVFNDIASVAGPAYDKSFSSEARAFAREIVSLRLDTAGTEGNFIGKVRVSESGSIMLFAVGLFSLAMARRKMKS